ncbi:DivIVA domain-containing protein [Microbacterium sp. SSM24]|uniref:DivIVA domain-containing protein n=1 Tax=Microbacterium sp. SSM24 TaxID=2991714 RepID=UPI0022268104|nr:DivIVA domain-containing protein [Microbacterium sp. SSM24]MCW3494742.1 DivIVA domain-containing protein [Microbacterium sp. SSM24]
MALTPDDVVTKQFQHVRFKEGFDPDEVDDFLDEIVVEWRKAIAENDELKAKLAAYESGAAPAQAAEPVAAAEPAAPEPVAAAPAPAVVADASAPGAASAGIIELAQRLHDEHVAEGVAQRDQLVADAKAQAASIINEAETRGREEVAKLDRERSQLEGRIAELRNFERDYRAQLRSYIEGKLRDLETTATTSGSTPVSSIGL